ncbi:unnamed protein product [Microthlaspi erraticum]|uniref:F-box domain-containing protein n=1 Tax=Microthlaspi erraticum TaxID=1685480 RepID=A0A6D2IA50_9BRAS|nr:unnamed protein product [Microthlaspi erraticum]
MATSSAPPQVKDEDPINWAELPSELMASILVRLSVVDILENAQKVCKPWRCVSKDRSIWRKVDMQNLRNGLNSGKYYLSNMCRQAIDRSDGGMVEINIGRFGTDSLLTYIADRSSNLRSLKFAMNVRITNEGLVLAVAKLPLLETLEISSLWFNLNLKAIGHSCPKLKTLKLNCSDCCRFEYKCDDDDALAIAESMPELRELQLLANRLTNTGLNAILDNCLHLEHLDLRQCLNINLSEGDMEKRCLERIKDFRRPNDSTADCPFYVAFSFR